MINRDAQYELHRSSKTALSSGGSLRKTSQTGPTFGRGLKYSKTCLEQPLKKKTKIGFQDRLLLSAGQKYCRMLQWEHSAILLTLIKLPFVINTFVLSIFEWPLKTSFTVDDDDDDDAGDVMMMMMMMYLLFLPAEQHFLLSQ